MNIKKLMLSVAIVSGVNGTISAVVTKKEDNKASQAAQSVWRNSERFNNALQSGSSKIAETNKSIIRSRAFQHKYTHGSALAAALAAFWLTPKVSDIFANTRLAKRIDAQLKLAGKQELSALQKTQVALAQGANHASKVVAAIIAALAVEYGPGKLEAGYNKLVANRSEKKD